MPLVVESCIRFINLNGKPHGPSGAQTPLPSQAGPGGGDPGTQPVSSTGLQHEGIFRVSGAQPRITEIRDAFERGGGDCQTSSGWPGLGSTAGPHCALAPSGEDPLVEGCMPHDLDSVAGVLKLYFRSLEPPLFPEDLVVELLASVGEGVWSRWGGSWGLGLHSFSVSRGPWPQRPRLWPSACSP